MIKNSYHPFTQKLLSTCEVFSEFPAVLDPKHFRDSLPCDGQLTDKYMVWTILKENIGKDLWSITMPVTFNEPLSFLQRINEQLEYAELLRMSNKCMDQYMRLAFVFGHSYMMFTNTIKRVNKTFNPLLGETYEYINKDMRSIMEQVCHHPPICAYYVESNDFILQGNFIMKTQLKLTSFKMVPTGETIVKLKSTGETFSLTKPKSRLYNYIIGKIYVWYEGPMECVNLDTKDKLEVVFRKKGWTSKSDYMVEGEITNGDGKVEYKVEGDWRNSLHLIDPNSKEITQICTRKPDPVNFEKQYNFTTFAIQSNHLTHDMLAHLPPTDSRFRPDIRAYEYGNIKLAGENKNKLEESQRERRKQCLESKKEWKPLWFEFKKDGNQINSRFKGDYWKVRETGKWPTEMLDLYN